MKECCLLASFEVVEADALMKLSCPCSPRSPYKTGVVLRLNSSRRQRRQLLRHRDTTRPPPKSSEQLKTISGSKNYILRILLKRSLRLKSGSGTTNNPTSPQEHPKKQSVKLPLSTAKMAAGLKTIISLSFVRPSLLSFLSLPRLLPQPN